MSLTNVDIAQRLGYTTRILLTPEEVKAQRPRFQYERYEVGIFNSKGEMIHAAYYSDPDGYDFIINHCVQLGLIPNWVALINVFKDIRSKVNVEVWSEIVKEMEKW